MFGKHIHEVLTGEVKTGSADSVLIASALGSCVAVIAYDPIRKSGALAHIMLPGRSPRHCARERLRYAEDAIDELLSLLEEAGAALSNIFFCIAGAGNVLRREDDRICACNIRSVTDALVARGFDAVARSVGGMQRRRVVFDIGAGSVRCAIGGGPEEMLWQWEG